MKFISKEGLPVVGPPPVFLRFSVSNAINLLRFLFCQQFLHLHHPK